MTTTHNVHLIEIVKEITIAKLSNSTTPSSELKSDAVTEFMQAVYDKLVELDSNAN